MNSKRRKTVAAVLLAFAASPAAVGDEHPIEPHDSIRAAAEQHVFAQTEAIDGRVEVNVGNLDSRLRLTRCDQALETYDSPNGLSRGRGVVGVRCTGSKPWKIYVPVQVAVMNEVVVSRRPLVNGRSVTADDLTLDEVDTAGMHRSYYTRIEDVVGLRARREIAAGTTLHAGLLQRAKLVRRGGQVQIVSNLGGLSVSMRGEALADGAHGDRVQVKNVRSGRVVTGTVTGSGVVEVLN